LSRYRNFSTARCLYDDNTHSMTKSMRGYNWSVILKDVKLSQAKDGNWHPTQSEQSDFLSSPDLKTSNKDLFQDEPEFSKLFSADSKDKQVATENRNESRIQSNSPYKKFFPDINNEHAAAPPERASKLDLEYFKGLAKEASNDEKEDNRYLMTVDLAKYMALPIRKNEGRYNNSTGTIKQITPIPQQVHDITSQLNPLKKPAFSKFVNRIAFQTALQNRRKMQKENMNKVANNGQKDLDNDQFVPVNVRSSRFDMSINKQEFKDPDSIPAHELVPFNEHLPKPQTGTVDYVDTKSKIHSDLFLDEILDEIGSEEKLVLLRSEVFANAADEQFEIKQKMLLKIVSDAEYDSMVTREREKRRRAMSSSSRSFSTTHSSTGKTIKRNAKPKSFQLKWTIQDSDLQTQKAKAFKEAFEKHMVVHLNFVEAKRKPVTSQRKDEIITLIKSICSEWGEVTSSPTNREILSFRTRV
ncbi:hypothetical protein V1514DRAFT_329203, partial [Lipomyces japonicus]|uniref:uncharacterized protein n=1 Tax=Lipomyces japonicus TaxID=56871 RepID=UPI0034CE8CA4